jgi:hypothetical protein
MIAIDQFFEELCPLRDFTGSLLYDSEGGGIEKSNLLFDKTISMHEINLTKPSDKPNAPKKNQSLRILKI